MLRIRTQQTREDDESRQARGMSASYPFAGIIRIRFEGFTGRAGVSGDSHPQDVAEYSDRRPDVGEGHAPDCAC